MRRTYSTWRRAAAAMLGALLLLGLLAPGALALTEGFKDIARAPRNALYTRLRLNGYEGTVYAFNGPEGQTEFRVYGAIGKLRGYYPVSVVLNETDEGEDEQTFTVELLKTRPVKDGSRQMGAATLTEGRAELPEGWQRARNRGLVYIENLFGVKEYRGYATFDGSTYYYFPTKNLRPVPGSLASVIEDMNWRARIKGQRVVKVPAELERGYQTWVYIQTTDGQAAMVPTDYPALDVDGLRASQPARSSASSGPRVMGHGSYGRAVTRLQNRLAELGYHVGKVDGQFGNNTQSALKAFQAANGLPQTGQGDQATLDKLYAQAAAANPPAQQQTPPKDTPPADTPPQDGPPPPFVLRDHVQMTLTASKTTLAVGETLTLNGSYTADAAVKENVPKLNATLVLLRTSNMRTVQLTEGSPASLTITGLERGTYKAMYHLEGGEHINAYKELTIVVGDGQNAPAPKLSDVVTITISVSPSTHYTGEEQTVTLVYSLAQKDLDNLPAVSADVSIKGNGENILSRSTGRETIHKFTPAKAGEYSATLTVTAGSDVTAKTHTFTVADKPAPPTEEQPPAGGDAGTGETTGGTEPPATGEGGTTEGTGEGTNPPAP